MKLHFILFCSFIILTLAKGINGNPKDYSNEVNNKVKDVFSTFKKAAKDVAKKTID